MSKINTAEVKRIAALAHVGVTDQEAADLAPQLDQIVEFASQLQATDITGIEPTSQVTGLTDVWREDVVAKPAVNREQLLANAPQQQDGFIKVRRVL